MLVSLTLTSDSSSCGLSLSSWEQLLTMNRSRDGTVFHPIAANVSLTVCPLQSDAVVRLRHSLKTRGSIQGCSEDIFNHVRTHNFLVHLYKHTEFITIFGNWAIPICIIKKQVIKNHWTYWSVFFYKKLLTKLKYEVESGIMSPPVVNVAITGSLLMSPLLEMSDTLYSVSGLRPSRLYCLSGGKICTLVSSEGSELGP